MSLSDFEVDGAPPTSIHRQSNRRRWNKWRRFRWTCRILGLVVIAIGVVAFFARGWLAERASNYVEERLSKEGIFFEHGPISYKIGRGLVVEDIVLFESEARERPLLELSNAGVEFGLGNLFLGEDVNLRSADISVDHGHLKLFDRGEPVVEIRDLQFFARSEPNHVEIQSAEGMLHGLMFQVRGNIRTGKGRSKDDEGEDEAEGREKKEPDEKEDKKLDFSELRKVGELIAFESEQAPPVFRATIDVDQREGAEEELKIEGEFEGKQTRWNGLPLDEIATPFIVTRSNQTAEVGPVRVIYRGKAIEGRMRYHLEEKKLAIEQLTSEADLIALLGEPPFDLGEKIGMIRMVEPPRFVCRGTIPTEDPESASVRVNCERGGTISIGTNDRPLDLKLVGGGGVSYESGVIDSESLAVELFGGRVDFVGAVNLAQDPAACDGRITLGGIDLDAVLSHLGREGDWPGVISGSFSGAGGLTVESLAGTGEIAVEGDALTLKGPFSLSQAVVATDGLTIGVGGGNAAVAARVDAGASPLSFDAAANLDAVPLKPLLDLAGAEAPVDGKLSGQFRSSGANTFESITANGELTFVSEEYHVTGPIALERKIVSTAGLAAKYGGGVAIASGDLNTGVSPVVFEGAVSLESMPLQSLLNLANVEKEMAGVLSGRFEGTASPSLENIAGAGEIQFSDEAYRIEGPYTFTGGVVETEGLIASLGGGRVAVQGKADLLAAPKAFSGDVHVDAVPIQSILDLAGTDKEVEGNLYGQFSGQGGESLASLNGSGAIRVLEGKLYSVPLFGQVNSFLAGVVPVFGKVEKNDLEATFTIKDGVLNSEDLVAASDMTRVEAAGNFNLADQTTRVTALAKVEGVVGVATSVVSKLLELEVEGPVNDLDIRLKNNAAEMAAGAVKGTVDMAKDGVKGTVDIAKDGVGDLTKGAKNVGGTAVRAGADGVKKVGQGLGKLLGRKKKEGDGDGEEAAPVEPTPPPANPGEPSPAGQPAPPPQS